MKSIKTVFKIGYGPSSSHTVGPTIACERIRNKYHNIDYYEVFLYGSLALTGKGHGTDKAIIKVLNNVNVIFDTKEDNLPHPNTMKFIGYRNNKKVFEETVLSIGGGDIKLLSEDDDNTEVYNEKTFTEIINYCVKNNLSLPEYIYKNEGEDIKDYLRNVYKKMKSCIQSGLRTNGILPGDLSIERKANKLFNMKIDKEGYASKEDRLLSAYAYAVAEENADGHLVVTAPTCGSSGVLPSVLYYLDEDKRYTEDDIIDGLAVAGLIGNIIRTNASISGAECGCQAEIGSACSMTAAAKAQINKLNLKQIEYAAEIAMEHHLGLTCDPVKGYVQIPCIERNAVAAMRAINAVNLSRFLYETRLISFDAVVQTMFETGKDMSSKYRETSTGGLASLYK